MENLYLTVVDNLRELTSRDFLWDIVIFSMAVSFFSMLTSFYSILRIDKQMRCDGLEPPSKHFMNIAFYFGLFMSSDSSIEKQMKAWREAKSMHKYFTFNVIEIQPYLKPMNRYVTWAFIIFTVIAVAAGHLAMVLYPE